jgi:VIT1/CCC1 family predicted Fe2+/Mn2+ transporter
MSMAAGEYVSVSSQADTEEADLARERNELATQPDAELDELAAIYEQLGVAPDLARQVAAQMMAKDAFEAHARDELGLAGHVMARPVQAALTSAVTFSAGAALPLIVALLAPAGTAVWAVSVACLIGLAALGAIGALAGGASIWKPTIRVVFWGAVAMAVTATIGSIIGRAI